MVQEEAAPCMAGKVPSHGWRQETLSARAGDLHGAKAFSCLCQSLKPSLSDLQSPSHKYPKGYIKARSYLLLGKLKFIRIDVYATGRDTESVVTFSLTKASLEKKTLEQAIPQTAYG